MEEFCISSGNFLELVVYSKPEVYSEFNFVRDGQVVGRIKGTFDFSDLPPKWHELGLRCIQHHLGGGILYLPSLISGVKPSQVTVTDGKESKRRWWEFWKGV